MRRKSLVVLLLSLIVVLVLGGCRRDAAPPVDLEPEDEATAVVQEAGENTDAMESPVATATEAPGATATPEPDATEAPTAVPTATTEPADPTPTSEPQPTAAPTATGDDGTVTYYVVQPGDNLFRIALRFNMTTQALAQANNITNPQMIYVGQRIKIPACADCDPTPPEEPPTPGDCKVVHVVQPGENLFRIALRYNYSQYYIAKLNNIPNPSQIYVGQKICIP